MSQPPTDDERRKFGVLLFVALPLAGVWLLLRSMPEWQAQNLPGKLALIRTLPGRFDFWLAVFAGMMAAWGVIWLAGWLNRSPFAGSPFRKSLRGTQIVAQGQLARMTRKPGASQIDVGGVPMPPDIEALHLLVNGATGAGKTVLLRQLAASGMARGDRFVFADPNGDMLAAFGRHRDVILNPFDARSAGWSIFNEIRSPYDFERYALSLIPRGPTREAEEWASYGRLLIREIARKLQLQGAPSVQELHRWASVEAADDLHAFVRGTPAEALFVGGAERALGSARFVLAAKLAPHLEMPAGDFSIRNWLEDQRTGNIFLTWREDMAESLRPLISAWVDVLCTSVLSTPENEARRLWLIIDELASLEKLASLEAALTKGRKHGLRVVAGLQSTAQLEAIYGPVDAQIIRSNFRTLVVLGGAKGDPKTCEDMSRALGEHEVARSKESITKRGAKVASRNTHEELARERVVMPSEIAALPDLTGYIAFAKDYPIARLTLKPRTFPAVTARFVDRSVHA